MAEENSQNASSGSTLLWGSDLPVTGGVQAKTTRLGEKGCCRRDFVIRKQGGPFQFRASKILGLLGGPTVGGMGAPLTCPDRGPPSAPHRAEGSTSASPSR